MNLNDIKKKRYNDVCICYTLNWQRNDLKKAAGISAASIAKLGKGANITTDILLKISEAMDCKYHGNDKGLTNETFHLYKQEENAWEK